jgi:hypothetical protein
MQIQISMIKKSELDPELESNKKRVRRKGVISFATISQILVRRTAPEIRKLRFFVGPLYICASNR